MIMGKTQSIYAYTLYSEMFSAPIHFQFTENVKTHSRQRIYVFERDTDVVAVSEET